jgi:hypothetical protein
MIDEEAARKIQLVPLSDNMIQRRIQDCASNVLDELVRRLRLSESFTVQLNESTDVVNLAILLVFVRYVYEGEFQEDLLLCKSTEAQITGKDIFQILDQFFINHQTDWNKCTDVCTNGAMTWAVSMKLLTFYTKVCWLSRGKVLMRVFQLSEEIAIFFCLKKKHH